MMRLTKNDIAEVMAARKVELWLRDERQGLHTTRGMLTIEPLVDQILFSYPESRRLGRVVVEAAALEPNPYCCRFMAARVAAIGSRGTRPRLTAATRVLLKPCSTCTAHERSVLTAAVHPEGVDPDPARQARKSLVASVVGSAKTNLHPVGVPCVTCTEWHRGLRTTLRAGADPVRLEPHRARPAPTGWARVAKHNGSDLPSCECQECRGSRILAYQNRGRP